MIKWIRDNQRGLKFSFCLMLFYWIAEYFGGFNCFVGAAMGTWYLLFLIWYFDY